LLVVTILRRENELEVSLKKFELFVKNVTLILNYSYKMPH